METEVFCVSTKQIGCRNLQCTPTAKHFASVAQPGPGEMIPVGEGCSAFFLSLPLKDGGGGGGFVRCMSLSGNYTGSTEIISPWAVCGHNVESTHHSLDLVLVYAGETRDREWSIFITIYRAPSMCSDLCLGL